jgi:hypothetical protein
MTNLTGPEAQAILEAWRSAGAIKIQPKVHTCQVCAMPLQKTQEIHVFHAEGDVMGIIGGTLFECSSCHQRHYIDQTTAI